MRQKAYIGLFAVLFLAYLGLNLLVAPDKATLAHYHLSSAGARAISIGVVIPISIIWLIGLYGSLKMKQYLSLIKKSGEGKPLNIITNGLMALVIAQPLTSVSANITTLVVKHHPNFQSGLTIFNNYLVIVASGAAFAIMAAGAWQLAGLTRKKINGYEQHIMTFAFIALSTLYSYAIINEPIHTALAKRLYYLPNWAILLTIAIPYLVIWYLGFLAAYCIYLYQKNVNGLVYKGSLVYVAAGVASVVLSSIAVRFLSTISSQISRLSITPVLFIIYGFLVLLGAGFFLIAWGAKKLRRIEEV